MLGEAQTFAFAASRRQAMLIFMRFNSATVWSGLIGAILAFILPMLQSSKALAETEVFNYEQLEAVTRITETTLTKKTLAWTSIVEIDGSSAVGIVRTVRSPTMKRYEISIGTSDRTIVSTYIVERDGLWYVIDNGKYYKCRPYEAVLALPGFYEFLSRSRLRFIDDLNEFEKTSRLQSLSDGIAQFRNNLTAEKKYQIETTFRNLEPILDAGKQERKKELAKKISLWQDVLKNGIELSVDVASGIVLVDGVPGSRVWTKDIAWFVSENPKPFDIGGANWEDKCQILAANESDRQNLILINHAPEWTPNLGEVDSDTVVLNIKTGLMSRVPFRTGDILPGNACFSQDRECVYVSGTLPEGGASALFEINLVTGVQRRLTSPSLIGYVMSPALSPDGTTLAVVHFSALGKDDRALQSQVLLVDVAKGDAKPLGESLDTAFLSWLPDGKGLILVSRKTVTLKEPSISTIVRMDLSGKITPLLAGAFPYVLPSGNRIFFLDEDSDQWKTCDLSSRNVRLVGDGLPKHGFPAVAPQGDQAIMMKYGGSKGPRPHLVDIATGDSTPIPVQDGLWIMPSWR